MTEGEPVIQDLDGPMGSEPQPGWSARLRGLADAPAITVFSVASILVLSAGVLAFLTLLPDDGPEPTAGTAATAPPEPALSPTAPAMPLASAAAPTAQPSPSPTPPPTSPAAPPDGPLNASDPMLLEEGDLAVVVATDPLVLRSAPGTDADSVIFDFQLTPGMRARVMEGPVEASRYTWYRVEVGEFSGWAAEAARDGEVWLAEVTNGLIAFSDRVDGIGPQVWTVDPVSRERMQLTQLPREIASIVLAGAAHPAAPADRPSASPVCQSDTYPAAWSPDGRTLAFVDGCVPYNAHLFTLDVAAPGAPELVAEAHDSPTWSPDGSRIAFAHNLVWNQCSRAVPCMDPAGPTPEPMPAVELGIRNADGSVHQLTDHPAWWITGSPVWSPDGRYIAYTAFEVEGGGIEIWLVDTETGEQRHLTNGSGPTWSPDGRHLAFTDLRGSDQRYARIYRIAVDGGTEQYVADGRTPKWSPDGRYIAYLAADGSLRAARPDGSESTEVVLGSVSGFDWSPDGRLLAVHVRTMDDIVPHIIVRSPGGGRFGDLGVGSHPLWQPVITGR